jgi:hypothetical protein
MRAYLIVTVLSRIIEPSVACVTPSLETAAVVPVLELLDDDAAFFLGSPLVGNTSRENKMKETACCHKEMNAMVKKQRPASIFTRINENERIQSSTAYAQ